eukprot:gene57676-biopygen40112
MVTTPRLLGCAAQAQPPAAAFLAYPAGSVSDSEDDHLAESYKSARRQSRISPRMSQRRQSPDSAGSSQGRNRSPSDMELSRKQSGVSDAIRTRPKHKTITLAAANRNGFLRASAKAPVDPVTTWLASEISTYTECISSAKGIIDLLSADRFFASFGAVKQCAGQQLAAIRSAKAFLTCSRDFTVRHDTAEGSTPLDWSSLQLTSLAPHCAACTGEALCGDFGDNVSQRFMCIDGISSLVIALERLATSWGAPLLVDTAVFVAIGASWNCRARDVIFYSKRGSDASLALWEVTTASSDMRAAAGRDRPFEPVVHFCGGQRSLSAVPLFLFCVVEDPGWDPPDTLYPTLATQIGYGTL